MRIINILVALLMLWSAIVPQHKAIAVEVTRADEIKTNFEISENIVITNKIVQGGQNGLIEGPRVVIGHETVKTADELKREKVLARYKDKLDKAVFPKGEFTINASAYTAAADECGKSDGITASGLKVKENNTIACPPSFPLGTKMRIVGYGTYVCEDRGGAIKGNHIDIYMKTKKEAFAFGRRALQAEVIN